MEIVHSEWVMTYLVVMENGLHPELLQPVIACHYWTWTAPEQVAPGRVAAFLEQVRSQSERWANEAAAWDDFLPVDLVCVYRMCPLCGHALLRDGNGLLFHAQWFLAEGGMENNVTWYERYRRHTCDGW